MERTQFRSSRFHYTFGPHAPTLRIQPSTQLRVICPDSDNEFSDGTILSTDQRQRSEGGQLFEANPMAGPIEIQGATPADSISVRIDAIHLDRTKGQTGLGYGHGLVSADQLITRADMEKGDRIPSHLYEWKIDTARGVATMVNPLGNRLLSIPLAPFIGCIGVCPPWGQSISTLYCGLHGGNMDIPLTRPGTTIHLPVFHNGALLMMGDIHAAQGHGEIIGGGIETSGQIDCAINLNRGQPIPSPRLIDDHQLSTIAISGDLRDAIRKAYAHLLNWLVEEYHLNRWDGYNLISQAGTITPGGLDGPIYSVAASLPRNLIEN
ncbi:MAG: acetamidase/formamidase family protein [Phycisphaerales bacterium]|nr:acetamidase/formamidase family protein [Phycisphaerales bacterium]